MVALGAGADRWLSEETRKVVKGKRRGDDYDSSSKNGEEVRKGMEQFQLTQALRAAISGLGFLMSVVGIWGDGY